MDRVRRRAELLPPVLWTHLATKDDLHALEHRLRTEFNGQFAQLNAKIDGGFAKIEAEFKNVGAEFKSVRAEVSTVKGETALMLAKQTRTVAFMLVGFALSIWIPLFVVGL